MEKLLTPQALGVMLSMSVQTVYNRRAQGLSLPPAVKLGRLLRFRESDVQTWITAQIESPVLFSVQPMQRRRGRPTKEEQVASRGK
ncbi:MAG: helix-turn-helix transcriptional regulator [Burkholderiales bacterium]